MIEETQAIQTTPEIDAAQARAADLLAQAGVPATITTAEEYRAAAEFRERVKVVRRDWTASTAPLLEKAKAVLEAGRALFARYDGPLKEADARAKQAMEAYLLRKAEAEAAERRRLEAARLEAERAERDRIAREAEERARADAELAVLQRATERELAGDRAGADAALSALPQVLDAAAGAAVEAVREVLPEPSAAAPEPTSTPTAERPAGAAGSAAWPWDFEILDEAKIGRAFLVPDLVKIRATVKAMKADAAATVGGIRVFQKPQVATSRSRA